ncbi:probable BOI-related E3 ubiquitin-protein ligase 3 [Tanacetum coccineum]
MYGSGMKIGFILEPAYKAESGVTYNHLPSRKRSRENGYKSTGSRGAKLLVPNFKSGATSAKWSLAPEMSWHQNSVGVVWHQNSGAIAFFKFFFLNIYYPWREPWSRAPLAILAPWLGTKPTAMDSLPSNNNQMIDTSVLLNEEVASQMYRHQLEIDHLVAQHAKKMRSEIGEMRRRSAKRFIVAANEGIVKRLKTKEDVITRLNQVNWSLEEKLKSLLVENQIWRELTQTNEATANNLQQLLAQAQLQELEQQEQTLVNDDIDDGESCCGSNYEEHGTKCLKCGKKELLDNETS